MNGYKKLFATVAVLALLGAGAAWASVADVRVSRRLFDREQLQVHTGTATINSASATFTGWVPLVIIAPEGNHALFDAVIVIDLDKATSGWHTTGGSATITCSVARAIDGTNYRTSNNLATTTLSGTNATGLSIEMSLGDVGPTEKVRLDVKLSSATGLALTDIPYVLYYRSGANATLTLAN